VTKQERDSRGEILARLASAFDAQTPCTDASVRRKEPSRDADRDALLNVLKGRLEENRTGFHLVSDRKALLEALANRVYFERAASVAVDAGGMAGEPWFLDGLRVLLPGVELVKAADVSPGELERCEVGVTAASSVLAATGAMALSASTAGGLAASLLPRIHYVVARQSDVVQGLATWTATASREKGLYHVHVSGPSRTADIEKKLVYGVHGPWKVSLFLLQSE